MKTISPASLHIVNSLPPVAKRGDKISIDSEFFGQDKERLHRPHGTFAWLGCSFDGDTIYYITDESLVQEFFDRLDAGVWIFHHAKYDITQLRPYADIPSRALLWDTMLIEQIRYSGYYSDFSLADLSRRYLQIYMPKDVRKQFGDAESLTREHIEYAAVDVAITHRVYQCQRQQIDADDLSLWKGIELPFFWELLITDGMPINRIEWMALYTEHEIKASAVQIKYMENPEILESMTMKQAKDRKLFSGINLGSWQQVGKELKRLKIDTKSTQEDDLKPYIGNEFVDDVLEYRGYMKLYGTYGKNWIDDGLIETDDKVYSNFHQIGASTGRISSSNPNVENIPVRDTPRFREMFTSGDPDWILVDADWSSQEPRIAAYLSQDSKMIDIFQTHQDVYIAAARLMFGWELTKSDSRRNKRMKPTVLGACYGLTEHGMLRKDGIPLEEGKTLLDTFFSTFTGMSAWKDRQRSIDDYVTTVYGRKFWLNPYNWQSANNALNSPVQGSGGDGLKIATSAFMKEVRKAGYGDSVKIINYIHDEILVICKKYVMDWTVTTLRNIMLSVAETMHEGIPADVEIGVGSTWHDAHTNILKF